jgi:ring-1,2-phenylacetyl-CoA epoxidase subunit PaaC
VGEIKAAFESRLAPILREAGLERPDDIAYRWFGKRAQHSEHLGRLLGDMQSLHRAHPGASW